MLFLTHYSLPLISALIEDYFCLDKSKIAPALAVAKTLLNSKIIMLGFKSTK